jgi:hypothetical protein
MAEVDVVIEVVGWGEWVRREWAASAPRTLAALADADRFFETIDRELSIKFAGRIRRLPRVANAVAVLRHLASGTAIDQWAPQEFSEERREALAVVTDFLLFDPRGHRARVEELCVMISSLPTPGEFARAIEIATLDAPLVAWVLGDSAADSGKESVQRRAREELADLYELHRRDLLLSALTQRQLSSQLFVFRKVQRAYAQAIADAARAEALFQSTSGLEPETDR